MDTDANARLVGAIDDALRGTRDSPASAVVRSALRVAILRQDPLGEFWLRIEMEGVSGSRGDRAKEALARLVALVGSEKANAQREAEFEALMDRRTIEQDGKRGILPKGIAELEAHTQSLLSMFEEPVTPGMTPLDTGLAAISRDKLRGSLAPTLVQQQAIIARVREAAFGYLLEAEAEILRGQAVPDVIAEGRAFVESELALRAPAAVEALASAQERLAHSDSEAMSHAATSCRRAIKALADALYPPGPAVTSDEGVTRVMDDEHYRNRLIEYVRQRRGKSTHADVLASNVVTLGTRLKSLDDLASKGVHSRVSTAEAEACVSWTYMLAADLLRVEQEVLQREEPSGLANNDGPTSRLS